MNGATICLKPINDLLRERFFVPSYQRGYRWTKRQVADLLDDLYEFQDNCDAKELFYCLQPVVVKRREDGAWELVDGQQRLTTIFLILTFLKLFLDGLNKSRFDLAFETRPESGTFLQNIDEAKHSENIDFHYICKAYEAVGKWFNERDGSLRIKLLQCLTNDDGVGGNVKVIWYELPVTEDSVEAFTRLNVGKIPLTNAELIRALFLQSGNFAAGTVSLQQIKIAQEWDGVEKTLQRDEVWYFLHSGKDSPSNRIEYLFQMIAREQTGIDPSTEDEFHTFRFYNGKLSDRAAKADAEWLEVKEYFMTLEEWFGDRTLYHLIGYLIHTGESLIELRKLEGPRQKGYFHGALKQRIFKPLMDSDLATHNGYDAVSAIIENKVTELEYGTDSNKIRRFLLLFNIATLLQNESSNLRFPFDSYKKENWDIEHVRSVESGKPNSQGDQINWLTRASECLSEDPVEKTIADGIHTVLTAEIFDSGAFDQLYKELLSHFGENEIRDTDNGIANLALLDAETNRSYKNALFPVKRRVILERDRDGTFVPLCTKNVFLKYYSGSISNMMFWSEGDRRAYLKAIVETLSRFFVSRGGSAA